MCHSESDYATIYDSEILKTVSIFASYYASISEGEKFSNLLCGLEKSWVLSCEEVVG